uniref:VP2 n=1 Tax=Banna virus TaxID=77763 RepID=A0A3G2KX55_BANNV|nr:VP2 [Banna virus]
MPRKKDQNVKDEENKKIGSVQEQDFKTAVQPDSSTARLIKSYSNPKQRGDRGELVYDKNTDGTTVEVVKQTTEPHNADGAVKDGRIEPVKLDLEKQKLDKLKLFETSPFDPLTIKNNQDVVDKLYATQSSSIQEVVPTKTFATELQFGVTSEDMAKIYGAVVTVSKNVNSSVTYEVKRGTQELIRIPTIPHNLKLIQSDNGKYALIKEELGQWQVETGVSLINQAGVFAVQLANRLGIDKPFILDAGSNYFTDTSFVDTRKYCTDGLSPREIQKALNRQRAYYDRPELTIAENKTLLSQSIIYSDVDGNDVSIIFSGAMSHAIFTYAQAQWNKNIIRLDDYIQEITRTVPKHYRPRRFKEIEHTHGYVYRELNQGSLMPLVSANLKEASAYYFKKLMSSIENVPVDTRTLQSSTSALAADTGQAMNRAQHVSMLTNRLTTANAPSVRAITVLTCMFRQFRVRMTHTAEPNIMDVAAATCMLLFRPAQSISDEQYRYCLQTMAVFLTNTTYDIINNDTIDVLKLMLRNHGWPFVERYNAVEIDMSVEPLRSPGQVGTYYNPFNIDPLTKKHVEDRLEEFLDQIQERRFRGRNNAVGSTLAAFLRVCRDKTSAHWQGYSMLVSRYRSLIPNELFESLRNISGEYNINPQDEHSFFFALAQVNADDEFTGAIDKESAEYLDEYATLARDVSNSLTLVKAAFGPLERTSGSIINHSNNLNKVINHVFADKPLISETILKILTIDGTTGKDGYRNWLNKLVGHNYPVYVEPVVNIMNFISARFVADSSYFGYTDEIMIMPNNVIVPVDERFGFRDSPFCTSLPRTIMGSEVRRISYSVFSMMEDVDEVINQGFILYDAHFNFTYDIMTTDGVTKLREDILIITDTGNDIKPIHFYIYFENKNDKKLRYESKMNIGYRLYVKTPACLLPINDYMRAQHDYVSPSSSRVYIKDPAVVYTRS